LLREVHCYSLFSLFLPRLFSRFNHH
jgi:hypothetical protein